jgi:hypothetical protein
MPSSVQALKNKVLSVVPETLCSLPICRQSGDSFSDLFVISSGGVPLQFIARVIEHLQSVYTVVRLWK